MPNVTMQMIADMAGVSLKTVSRVVNREKGVRKETRERVEALIRETEYEPNPSARGLASARSSDPGPLRKVDCPVYIIAVIDGFIRGYIGSRVVAALNCCVIHIFSVPGIDNVPGDTAVSAFQRNKIAEASLY